MTELVQVLLTIQSNGKTYNVSVIIHSSALIHTEHVREYFLIVQVALEDGTVLDKSVKESEELGQEDEVVPAIFKLGYGQVIPGWELGITGMCLG